MLISVKDKTGRRFRIIVPIWIAQAGLNIADSGFVRKWIPDKAKQYMDCVDFKKLKGSLELLKSYRGLKLVDVKDSKGVEVVITI